MVSTSPLVRNKRSVQKKVRWLVETFSEDGKVVASETYTTQVAMAKEFGLCKETVNSLYKGRIRFDGPNVCHKMWLWRNKRISWIP